MNDQGREENREPESYIPVDNQENYQNEVGSINSGPLFFDSMSQDAYLLFDEQYNHNLSPQQRAFKIMENRISLEASFSFLRLCILYLLLFLENFHMNTYIQNLVILLLVYEGIIISNYLLMKAYLFIMPRLRRGNRRGEERRNNNFNNDNQDNQEYSQMNNNQSNNSNIHFPVVCIYADNIAYTYFFLWFIYGLYEIIYDAELATQSLINNPLVTYYVTVVILFGFFFYAKFIFYLLFFIIFGPCLIYWLAKDCYDNYERSKRREKVLEEFVEEVYEEYIKRCPEGLESCPICMEEYKPKDIVIALKCDQRHVYHANHIRDWIKRKPTCPYCNFDLSAEFNENNNNHNN